MKRYILLIAALVSLFSCIDDESTLFDVDLTGLEISFVPFEGGAYMNYALPANADIYGIQVKYHDFNGQKIMMKRSHTCKQIELVGFNEAQENVPIEIVLLDNENRVSEIITKTFSTLNSAAYGIELEIASHWNGFRVTYPEVEGLTTGIVNIYYVGVNPKTQNVDSLLVSSLPIYKEGYTFKYSSINDEELDDVTVVVKTEDSRGNFVKTIVKTVDIAHAGQFNSSDIGFTGSSVEDDIKKTGWKYLFDGDKKGLQCLQGGDVTKYYSYMSEVGAEFDDNKNVLTLDLQSEKQIASMRIYSHLSVIFPASYTGGLLGVMKNAYRYYYPNHVTLYGTNDPHSSEEEWEELATYYESALLDLKECWIAPAYDTENYFTPLEVDLFKAEDPNYLEFNCDITGEYYRYLKVKIHQTYYYKSATYENGKTGQFGLEELEIYVEKE